MEWDSAEELRRMVAEIVADQPDEPEPGRWKIEASMVHSPTPWSYWIVSDVLQHWIFGAEAELLEIEIGYRAAWRMGVETGNGTSRRFIQAKRDRCKVEGHLWVGVSEGMRRLADRSGWDRWCPRCAHTNGPNCRCSFCIQGLHVAE